ncbi:hypothetical protein HRE53_00055 [Acaryochloris sp. 'Moss Beach']|uniref:hypothetical protein n=1 Tax=Acaryochloris sp. 'Moss Beach' TaxID=2740837 RepID=UPI001F1C9975|nr:hypothetical protein [Acaryochloris sp. 'Moss Beach']UJB69675.1 hypothetical protein HRE53_00055 [Acaryochloris sp. 'Moss Beach']
MALRDDPGPRGTSTAMLGNRTDGSGGGSGRCGGNGRQGDRPFVPHWAVEDALLVATDEGIARVQVDQGRLILQRQFPETEPFVQTGYQVLAAPQGLYTVGAQTIQLLQL